MKCDFGFIFWGPLFVSVEFIVVEDRRCPWPF